MLEKRTTRNGSSGMLNVAETKAPTTRLLNTEPKKATGTTVDTILITPEIVNRWKSPPFQRPLRVNAKVQALAAKIQADGGVLPGVITVGVFDKVEYLLDGQHRREAFLLSTCQEGFTDVRKHFFDSMASMGEEWVNLNSSLVRMRPDDILRGLEGTIPGLGEIRKKCPFVGYDMIRRNDHSPILSMSSLLRCWFGSSPDVPSSSGGSVASRVALLTVEEVETCTSFLLLAEKAWGRDVEYSRLWGSLNLTLVMWLFRRTVLTRAPASNSMRFTKENFSTYLMALSAHPNYMTWLTGRHLSDRDRSPAYSRIKAILGRRIETTTGVKARLPQPAWAHHNPGNRTLL